MFFFQKVHMFQKSLDAVLQRLGECEMGQNALSNTASGLQPGTQTPAAVENEILLFRNQLKIQSANLVSPPKSHVDRQHHSPTTVPGFRFRSTFWCWFLFITVATAKDGRRYQWPGIRLYSQQCGSVVSHLIQTWRHQHKMETASSRTRRTIQETQWGEIWPM